jgi:hypothetical protein
VDKASIDPYTCQDEAENQPNDLATPNPSVPTPTTSTSSEANDDQAIGELFFGHGFSLLRVGVPDG